MTICQVQSLELARQAADAGADALLAQGNEAGGHTGEMNLLPLLVELLERYPHLPMLAAGGITSGRNAEILARREELASDAAARARHDPDGASVTWGRAPVKSIASAPPPT